MSNNPATGKTDKETVQTVQEGGPYKEPYFELSQDKKEQWHWVLWAANGRAMATNPTAYERRNDATEAIKTLRENIEEATKVVIVHTN